MCSKAVEMTSVAHIESPMGWIEICGEDAYISSVSFVDAAGENSDELTLTVIECKKQLEEYFEGNRKQFELPIFQDGTSFQKQVWEQLCSIPFGKTISYLQLAQSLGNPKCIRAAGTANGRNKIAIIVPCHRVIGSNGSLVGYMGGLNRKKWLLEHEARLYGQQILTL